MRNDILFGHNEPIPHRGRQDQLARRCVDQNIDDLRLIWQINHQAHRLAHAAAPRQGRGLDRIEPSIIAHHDQFIGGIGMEGKARAIAIFEFQLAAQVDMAGHCADPAHVRTDHCDRLFVDHRFDWDIFNFNSMRQFRAARAACVILAERLFSGFDLIGNRGPL